MGAHAGALSAAHPDRSAVSDRTGARRTRRIALLARIDFPVTAHDLVGGCAQQLCLVELDHAPAELVLHLGAVFLVGVVFLVLGFALGPQRPDTEKLSPYECGFEAFEDARMKFDVRYYLVAILFIIFDLEIAFLFPWAVVLDKIGVVGLVAMLLFLAVLVVGFIYEWKKGALEWE